MEPSFNHSNAFVSLLPMFIIMIPMIFIIRALAREKGKDVILFTILACIPILNFITLPYIVGTPSKILEDKIDKILETLERLEKK
jgi:hypothetical protein